MRMATGLVAREAYGYGYISVSEMPQLQKGQVNRVKASIALQRPIRRYAN